MLEAEGTSLSPRLEKKKHAPIPISPNVICNHGELRMEIGTRNAYTGQAKRRKPVDVLHCWAHPSPERLAGSCGH